MPLPITLQQAAVAFGDVSSPFNTRTAVALAANANSTIGFGWSYVETDANSQVQFSPDAGTTQITLVAVSSAALIWSDGFNFRLHSTGLAATGHTTLLKGGGQ